MVLLQDPAKQPFYSVVGTDSTGHLCSLPRVTTKPPTRTGIFTGIHILHRDTLQFLEAIPSGINEVLYPTLMKKFPNRVGGEFMEFGRTWSDTGDLLNFRKTTFVLLNELSQKNSVVRECLTTWGGYEEKKPGLWMPKAANNIPVSFKPPVVIGKDCKIESDAEVGPYTVIGDNSTIQSGVKLSRFIALEKSNVTRESSSQGDIQFEKSIIKH